MLLLFVAESLELILFCVVRFLLLVGFLLEIGLDISQLFLVLLLHVIDGCLMSLGHLINMQLVRCCHLVDMLLVLSFFLVHLLLVV